MRAILGAAVAIALLCGPSFAQEYRCMEIDVPEDGDDTSGTVCCEYEVAGYEEAIGCSGTAGPPPSGHCCWLEGSCKDVEKGSDDLEECTPELP